VSYELLLKNSSIIQMADKKYHQISVRELIGGVHIARTVIFW